MDCHGRLYFGMEGGVGGAGPYRGGGAGGEDGCGVSSLGSIYTSAGGGPLAAATMRVA